MLKKTLFSAVAVCLCIFQADGMEPPAGQLESINVSVVLCCQNKILSFGTVTIKKNQKIGDVVSELETVESKVKAPLVNDLQCFSGSLYGFKLGIDSHGTRSGEGLLISYGVLSHKLRDELRIWHSCDKNASVNAIEPVSEENEYQSMRFFSPEQPAFLHKL
jgi:hypothetical protein